MKKVHRKKSETKSEFFPPKQEGQSGEEYAMAEG